MEISRRLKSARLLLDGVRASQRALLQDAWYAPADDLPRTLSDDEAEQYDNLELEAKMLEREIAMLGELLEREAATAKPPRSWED